jgi:hypothetical protein
MLNAENTGLQLEENSGILKSFPMDSRALFQTAVAPCMIQDSSFPKAPVPCELSVRNVRFEENALSDTMKRKFAEARVYAAQVRARKAMGDKWILSYVQKHR